MGVGVSLFWDHGCSHNDSPVPGPGSVGALPIPSLSQALGMMADARPQSAQGGYRPSGSGSDGFDGNDGGAPSQSDHTDDGDVDFVVRTHTPPVLPASGHGGSGAAQGRVRAPRNGTTHLSLVGGWVSVLVRCMGLPISLREGCCCALLCLRDRVALGLTMPAMSCQHHPSPRRHKAIPRPVSTHPDQTPLTQPPQPLLCLRLRLLPRLLPQSGSRQRSKVKHHSLSHSPARHHHPRSPNSSNSSNSSNSCSSLVRPATRLTCTSWWTCCSSKWPSKRAKSQNCTRHCRRQAS